MTMLHHTACRLALRLVELIARDEGCHNVRLRNLPQQLQANLLGALVANLKALEGREGYVFNDWWCEEKLSVMATGEYTEQLAAMQAMPAGARLDLALNAIFDWLPEAP